MMPQLTPVNRRKLLTMLGGSIAAPYLVRREAFARRRGHPAGEIRQRLSGRRRHRYPVADHLPEDERPVRTDLRRREQGRRWRRAGGRCGGEIAAGRITLGLGGIASNVLAIGSYAKLPYDPRGDFTFIGGMWQLPNILVARKDLFSSDIRELLAAFRKEPRQIHLRLGRDSAPRCISPAR